MLTENGSRENLKWAIAAYKQALRIRTPEKYPRECLATGCNLGDAAFEVEEWEDSLLGYNYAIRAIIADEQHYQAILGKTLPIHQKMSQIYTHHGKELNNYRHQNLEELIHRYSPTYL